MAILTPMRGVLRLPALPQRQHQWQQWGVAAGAELQASAAGLSWPLFALRCGRAADRAVAKYELTHAVRSHIGSDDDAFNAIRQREDEVRAPHRTTSPPKPCANPRRTLLPGLVAVCRHDACGGLRLFGPGNKLDRAARQRVHGGCNHAGMVLASLISGVLARRTASAASCCSATWCPPRRSR